MYDPNPHAPRASATSPLAIVAMVMSLLGFITGITALVGAILGHVALGSIRRTGESGRAFAITAVAVGWALTGIGMLVAVMLLVVSGVFSGLLAGTGAAEPPPAAPTAPAASAAGDDECDPAAIVIEPSTDAAGYPAGVLPQISMSIANTGPVACTFDVGAQEYLIASGSEAIWISADCFHLEPIDLVLEPGTPLTTTPFAWDRTRSSPGTCASARPEVAAGGATYRLSVRLGPVESAGDVAFVLY